MDERRGGLKLVKSAPNGELAAVGGVNITVGSDWRTWVRRRAAAKLAGDDEGRKR